MPDLGAWDAPADLVDASILQAQWHDQVIDWWRTQVEDEGDPSSTAHSKRYSGRNVMWCIGPLELWVPLLDAAGHEDEALLVHRASVARDLGEIENAERFLRTTDQWTSIDVDPSSAGLRNALRLLAEQQARGDEAVWMSVAIQALVEFIRTPLGPWAPWRDVHRLYRTRNPRTGDVPEPSWLDFESNPYWTPEEYPEQPTELGGGLRIAGEAARWRKRAESRALAALTPAYPRSAKRLLDRAVEQVCFGFEDYLRHRGQVDRREPAVGRVPFFDLFDHLDGEGERYPHPALDELESVYRACIGAGARTCTPTPDSWASVMDRLDDRVEELERTGSIDALAQGTCDLVAAYGLVPVAREDEPRRGERLGVRMWQERNADIEPEAARAWVCEQELPSRDERPSPVRATPAAKADALPGRAQFIAVVEDAWLATRGLLWDSRHALPIVQLVQRDLRQREPDEGRRRCVNDAMWDCLMAIKGAHEKLAAGSAGLVGPQPHYRDEDVTKLEYLVRRCDAYWSVRPEAVDPDPRAFERGLERLRRPTSVQDGVQTVLDLRWMLGRTPGAADPHEGAPDAAGRHRTR